ncbi:cellulose biosynthesis protein BcsN [Methylobacterium sp. NMS14P]|uniref:cellulose biosynthesis protein BcsN n=1 Tax=Methylobacterium sp. NMS14P TaxID=2894310 RepID=UPI002359890E|nr:cellulose biosynthesis protein BcsN [Methylobacterium sp. NMS14P]WCS25518.1 cellulose biosynthesis protein BcsN [Methylobacterium sp. NMS14P]
MRRVAIRAARLCALAWLLLPAVARAQTVPVLSLPGAGALTAVVETRERDGFDQRLRYAGGDGRNHAEIALRRETADLLLAFPPRLAKPSEFGIAGEIAVRFPGQAMTVRPPLRNAYGPVGIALGADCLYAWQWIEGGRGAAAASGQPPALFQAEPLARRAISLRIRLCRTAEASLGDLVRAVEGLRIALPGIRPPPAVVRVPPRRVEPRAVARRPSRPAAAEAPKDEAPPPRTPAAPPPQTPVAPPVAPPPGAAAASPDQRRYIVPPTPQAPAPVPPEPGSQRYITEGSGSGIAPKPAPGQAPGETFFRDLPPEAYRPPN